MDSVVKKLSEIESTASAIVQHAEEQKKELEQESREKRRIFDDELERDTQAKIQEIRSALEQKTSSMLDGQSTTNDNSIAALRRNYDEKHTLYAQDILKRITEV